ncbi:hypothetical protein PTKIN_Ptkin13bG0114600 [Pterospermum kingtungense]
MLELEFITIILDGKFIDDLEDAVADVEGDFGGGGFSKPDRFLLFPIYICAAYTRFKESATERQKVRWNLDSGLEKLDILEKFQQGFEDKDKGEEKKSDGEEDNTDEESGEVSDGSYSEVEDCNENEHFDNDEDDYHLEDNCDDESIH